MKTKKKRERKLIKKYKTIETEIKNKRSKVNQNMYKMKQQYKKVKICSSKWIYFELGKCQRIFLFCFTVRKKCIFESKCFDFFIPEQMSV